MFPLENFMVLYMCGVYRQGQGMQINSGWLGVFKGSEFCLLSMNTYLTNLTLRLPN
jgi:hypothetical protein